MRKLLWLSLLALLWVGSPAQAQYVVDFPTYPTDTFSYSYPEMDDAGEKVVGYRNTPAIPSVNAINVFLGVDASALDCWYADLGFYFDDIYIGTARIPLAHTDYFTITGTFTFTPSQVKLTTNHKLEVRLINTLPYCGDWIELDVENSYWELDLVGADADNDGSYSPTWGGGDCNDGDASIAPGKPELCDAKDNNCNGATDEGVTTTYYQDSDTDTYGKSGVTVQACSAPSGYVARGGDCNDSDTTIYPNAPELCDNKDNDCDTTIDEGVKGTYYRDADADTYGTTSNSQQACSAPSGYTNRGGDCNDGDNTIYPNAPELCDGKDNNCNVAVDEGVATTWYRDQDADTYGSAQTTTACSKPTGYAANGGDCNDADNSIYPNAPELCDTKDNNCNGSTDEGVTTAWYPDGDADGAGTSSGATQACSQPSGYASSAGDCNDADNTIYPTAPELCDAKDNNCNSQVDEGVKNTYYADGDGDTYGVTAQTTQACSRPSGYASAGGDCNDGDVAIYPNAPELCDGKDNNCNSTVDEGVKNTYYKDQDGDGVGVFAQTTQACSLPATYSESFGDCNDTDASIYPQASELCDGKDNDCDNVIDDGVLTKVYRDADGDSYGDNNQTLDQCSPPAGYVGRGNDCNDQNAAINPGEAESCNGVDDNCSGIIDEGVKTTWYADADGDTYGDPVVTAQACSQPNAYVIRAGDCDDTRGATNPAAPETCNGIDDNCDTTVDEGVKTTFYQDTDGDTYGVASSTTQACARPSGYAAQAGDCAPSDASAYPGAPETCDGVDDNCDGETDEGVKDVFYQDTDQDGYGVDDITTLACATPTGYADTAGDCNDGDASVNPAGDESCDGADDDCDSLVDEDVLSTYYTDADGDAHGAPDAVVLACSRPNGAADVDDDCDDQNGQAYPGATEACNGVDDDCDGTPDDGVKLTFYTDSDGDGFGNPNAPVQACSAPAGAVANPNDCDDTKPSVKPGGTEVCNNIDDNCNGEIDEAVKSTFYQDADGDTYGNASVPRQACTRPSGFVADQTDCNDAVASIYPDAPEACNLVDDDCDGVLDEGVQTVFYADQDADSFGDDATTTLACVRPSGFSNTGGDCDDSQTSINPNADEVCDEVDQDCDEAIDEGVTTTYYLDFDEDTYGDPDETVEACELPADHAELGTDCDDLNADIYPGAPEICGDTVDQDCNTRDLSCDVTDRDLDGFAPVDGDCDDDDDSVYPEAPEACDGKDNNCDGPIDNRDEDADGFVAATCGGPDCDDTDETINPDADEVCGDGLDNDCSGAADDLDADDDGALAAACDPTSAGDCDDDDPRLHPGAEETCDGLDNDCSGVTDDRDVDEDGATAAVCGGPDCDDANDQISPTAAEVVDGIDNNCDGNVDEGSDAFDDDQDGYSEAGGDCDDNNTDVNPGELETPGDGVDNNCNGEIDEVDITETPEPTPTLEPTPTATAPVETPTLGTPPLVTPTPTQTPTGETPTGETPTATPTGATPTDVTPTATPTLPDQPGTATPSPTPTLGTGGEEGCQCNQTPAAGSVFGQLALVLGLLLVRRRR